MADEKSEMTREQYETEKVELQRAHDGSLRELRERAERVAREGVESDVKASLIGVNVRSEAIEDVCALVLGRVTFSDDLKPGIRDPLNPPKLLSVAEFARQLVRDRAYLQAPKPADAAAIAGTKWDIDRAITDMAYTEKWRAEDPEGYKKAWATRIEELGDKQRQAAMGY